MLKFVSGLSCTAVNAKLSTTVSGFAMDETDTVQLEFEENLKGLLWAGLAAPGHRNDLRFKIVGSKGMLEWQQEAPETLRLSRVDQADLTYRRGSSDITGDGRAAASLPAGSPDAFLETLAMLYGDFATALDGKHRCREATRIPISDVEHGARGVLLGEACVASSRSRRWVSFSDDLAFIDGEGEDAIHARHQKAGSPLLVDSAVLRSDGKLSVMASIRTGRAVDEVDYVIVGGGSAGCTVVSRLDEDASLKRLILEEGPSDWSPYIHLLVTYYKTAKCDLLTCYSFEGSPAQRAVIDPTMIQARVLGGGSSVNAMLYVRRTPADYDSWEASGAEGWGYAGLLLYFRRAEGNNRFAGETHGTDGLLGVSDPPNIHPITRRWLQACQQAGLPFNADFNCGDQAGCGFYQITARNGRRSSASVSYLRDARRRRNFEVRTGSRVIRIVIEGGRAVGVEYDRSGKREFVRAKREVILSAGSLSTPKLLVLSGVGPAAHLRKLGIAVIKDHSGFGRNYQDHMERSRVYLNGPHRYAKYKELRWKAWAAPQYALFRNGPDISNIIKARGFWWSGHRESNPDVKLFFLAGAGVEEGVDTVPGHNGCTVSVTQARPKSVGYVELCSANPMAPPVIAPRYLTDPYDTPMHDGRCAAGLGHHATTRTRFLSRRSARPLGPLRSDNEFEDFVRREAHAALHPCGTCRIGTDNQTVVDPNLKVHGVQALRVVDASVMPAVISGNLKAVAIMIGEKAADLISGRPARSADPAGTAVALTLAGDRCSPKTRLLQRDVSLWPMDAP